VSDKTHAQRLTTNQSPAVGLSHFTPDQQFLRTTNAGGRWGRGEQVVTMATAFNMKFHDDGTVDLIRLEAGEDGWQDLGGQGAYDVRAGRC